MIAICKQNCPALCAFSFPCENVIHTQYFLFLGTHETLAQTSHWFDPHDYCSREREREQTFIIQPDVQVFSYQR